MARITRSEGIRHTRDLGLPVDGVGFWRNRRKLATNQGRVRMRSNGRIRQAGLVGTVTIVAVGGTTMAVAADGPTRGSSSTTLHACITPVYKTVQLTTAGAKCPEGFRKISFAAKGEQGKKGTRGTRGTRGPAGADGAAGAQGANGLPGAQGAPGVAGTQGIQGVQGLEGIQGVQGIQGIQGFAGIQGVEGMQGPIGFTGATGPQGPQGVEGPVGPDGALGPVGPNGGDGASGPQGPVGPTGLTGQTGPIGPAGPQGDEGDAGPVGPAGPQGDTGATGNTGATGSTGPQGVAGDTGPAGPAGPQGATGNTGPAGPQGTTGNTGPAGATGAAGPAGPSGGGVTLKDANDVTLGKVVGTADLTATVVTSTGHVLTISWAGMPQLGSQIYYAGACATTSTMWLNGGSSQVRKANGKLAVYSQVTGSYLVPKTVGADGTVTSGAMTGLANGEQTSTSSSAGTCQTQGTSNNMGYELKAVAASAVGMPATIAAPLTVQ